MKIIRTDNFGRDMPEQEIAAKLTREAAEKECERLNGPLNESSQFWHIVTEEDYVPLTYESIHGL